MAKKRKKRRRGLGYHYAPGGGVAGKCEISVARMGDSDWVLHRGAKPRSRADVLEWFSTEKAARNYRRKICRQAKAYMMGGQRPERFYF